MDIVQTGFSKDIFIFHHELFALFEQLVEESYQLNYL